MAVKKDFKCTDCNEVYEMELPMEQTKCACPKCGKDMQRIYSVSISRPQGDNSGFYGIDKK